MSRSGKGAIYARMSSDRQNPLSPADQIRKCKEFADEMGADGYGKDAMACVALAKQLIGVTR